jgi:hypothetical protein
MLHALAAALEDVDWRHLPREQKLELDRQAEARLARMEISEK